MTTLTAAQPATDHTDVAPVTMLRGLVLDVGLPVAAYYALHALGASDWTALLAGTAIAATRVTWSAVQSRRLNAFATVMLLVYGAGFALAFATGDPRTMLLRHSLVTAGVGTLFLVTAIRGRRPLTLAAAQSFAPAKAAAAQHEFDTDADVRRGHRVSSAVWGAGLLAEAIVRIPLVYALPVEIAVGATEILMIATFALLAIWNGAYVARARKRG